MKSEKIKNLRKKLGEIFLKKEKERLVSPEKFVKLDIKTNIYLGLLNFIKTFSMSISFNVLFFAFIGGFFIMDFNSSVTNLLSNLFIFSTSLTFLGLTFKDKIDKNKQDELIKEKLNKEDLLFLEERFLSGRSVDEFSLDYSRLYDSIEFQKFLSSLRMRKEDIEFFSQELKVMFNESELKSALNSKELIDDVKENNGVSYQYLYKLLKILETQTINKKSIDFQYNTLLSLKENGGNFKLNKEENKISVK